MESFFKLFDHDILKRYQNEIRHIFSMLTYKQELIIAVNVNALVEQVDEYSHLLSNSYGLSQQNTLYFLTGYKVKDLENFTLESLIVNREVDRLEPLYCIDSCDVFMIIDDKHFTVIKRLSSFNKDASLSEVISKLRSTYRSGRRRLVELFLRSSDRVDTNSFFSSVRDFMLRTNRLTQKQVEAVFKSMSLWDIQPLFFPYLEYYRKDKRPCNGKPRRSIQMISVDEKNLIPTEQFKPYQYSFKYFNPVQSKALQYLDDDCNLVVSAATSSGKTILAELFMWKTLQSGKRVLYVSPMKALTAEKYSDWSKKFNVPTVLATSDFTDSDKDLTTALVQSKIICMTSEMLDSKSRKYQQHKLWMQDVGLVIIDEAHIIGTPSRGLATEVGIIRFLSYHPEARVIFLSATAPNVLDFSDWLEALTRRKTVCIKSDWRPVPVELEVTEPDSIPEEVIRLIDKYPNDKFLIFVGTKAQGRNLLKKIRQYLTLKKIADNKVKFHSADLSLQQRKEIESSFKEGNLQYLVSTSTLAWGVNLPARHVIVAGTMRTDADPISTADIIQMAGRAGRLGLDEKGYVHILKSTGDVRDDDELITAPPVTSQLAIEVNTSVQSLVRTLIAIVDSVRPDLTGSFIEALQHTDPKNRSELMALNQLLCQILFRVKPKPVISGDIFEVDDYSFYRTVVLSEIATGSVHNLVDLLMFLSKSLAHFQGFEVDLVFLIKILFDLRLMDTLKVRGQRIIATDIGRVVTNYYILIEDALQLISNMKFLVNHFDDETFSLMPPQYIAWLFAMIPSKLLDLQSPMYVDKRARTQKDKQIFRTTSGKKELFYNPTFVRKLYNKYQLYDLEYTIHKQTVPRTFPNFQVFYHHLLGRDLSDMRSDVRIRGQMLLADMDRFGLALVKINRLLNFTTTENVVNIIKRLQYGIPPELIPLVSIKNIGRTRAKLLYEAGIKSVRDLFKHKDKLPEILGQRVATEVLRHLDVDANKSS